MWYLQEVCFGPDLSRRWIQCGAGWWQMRIQLESSSELQVPMAKQEPVLKQPKTAPHSSAWCTFCTTHSSSFKSSNNQHDFPGIKTQIFSRYFKTQIFSAATVYMYKHNLKSHRGPISITPVIYHLGMCGMIHIQGEGESSTYTVCTCTTKFMNRL